MPQPGERRPSNTGNYAKDSTRSQRSGRVRRIARLFWCLPIVLAVPTFLAVGQLIPDYNNGSIADGFRRLNAFFAAILPVLTVCWATAVVLTSYLDIPTLTGVRKTIFIIGVSLIWLFIVLVAVALLTGWPQ